MRFGVDAEGPSRHDDHPGLGEFAGLAAPPEVIECFDVSHLQGREVVASMVRCVDGRMDRTGYRHFRIRENETNDDFASMNEILRRRYRGVGLGLHIVDALAQDWAVAKEGGSVRFTLAGQAVQ